MSSPPRTPHHQHHHRRNTFLLGTVEMGWGIALALLDSQSVLPVLLATLGADYRVLSVLPILYYAVLPFEVLSPYLTESLPRKKLLVWAVHLAVPLVWGAIGLWLLRGDPQPGRGAIALFYACWFASQALIGFLAPVWYDFMGKITDPARRGSAFSLIFSFQSVAGLTGALVVQELVRPARASEFAALFLAACVAAQVTNQAFLFTVEEPGAKPPPRPPLGDYARSLVGFFREDRSLRRYVLARAVTRAAPVVSTFYAVQAKGHFATVPVGGFAATVVAGKLLMSVLAWRFSDGAGMKPFLVLGYLALAAAATLAALADGFGLGVGAYYAVALLVGAYLSCDSPSNATFVMNLAPEGKRASYMIAVNTCLFPLAVGLPLLLGELATRYGPARPQLVFAGVVVLAAVFLAGFVEERRASPPDIKSPGS